MDNKRKQKVTQTHTDVDYNEIQSKKPNIAENAFGTPSLNLTNNQGTSLPTIVLNMVNPEQITADARHTRLNDYVVREVSRGDGTYLEKSIRSTVITSVSLQDNGYSYYWTQDNEKINDNPSKSTACNNTTNVITCNCIICDPSEYYSDDEVSSVTTEHTDLFQYSDDEINTIDSGCSDESIRSTVITSVSQQDSGYYCTQNEKEINGIRSKFTACDNYDPNEYYSDGEVQQTDDFGTAKCLDTFHCNDHEINTTSSECSDEPIRSTIFQQDNDYNYYDSTENVEEMNDTRPEVTISNNITNDIACKRDDLGENYTNYEVKIANCFTTNDKHHSMTNSFQCSNDENNTALSLKKPIASTILTSVRQQKNGRCVYVTEYDKEMNEISSEVYNIVNPKFISPDEQSFILTPADPHLNGYNEERAQQPPALSEHNKDPEVLICTLIPNNILPNNISSDDETHSKVTTVKTI